MEVKTIPNKELIIVSGPSRSGKSKWAENLLSDSENVVYIATSVPNDDLEWLERINIHKERRPDHWKLIESPDNIQTSIGNLSLQERIIIDSLGAYVARYLHKNNYEWEVIATDFVNFLLNQKRYIIIVVEETGWGVVPVTLEGNLFRDRLGLLSQALSKVSTQKWLVIQGSAINLDKISIEIP